MEGEARALSRGGVMREGVLVVGGGGKRDAHKMHPCGWRRRKVSRIILGLQRWEDICNQDSFSLLPSLSMCLCACVCVTAMSSGHCSRCTGSIVRCPPGIRKHLFLLGR